MLHGNQTCDFVPPAGILGLVRQGGPNDAPIKDGDEAAEGRVGVV